MKVAVAIFLAVVAGGCSPPTSVAIGLSPSQTPAPAPAASVWGMVVEDTGACIKDATIEVVSGQALGRTTTQATPCGAWDYGGGFAFNDLIPGAELTLRASAPGYAPEEMTVRPSFDPQMAVLLTPARTK